MYALQGDSWDSLPEGLIEDCAQLCKANSIEGNKKDNVTVVYTPWSNLMKRGDMEVGQVRAGPRLMSARPCRAARLTHTRAAGALPARTQVGFHNQKLVKRFKIPTRKNEIINRLNKTKTERFPDLRAERLARDKAVRRACPPAIHRLLHVSPSPAHGAPQIREEERKVAEAAERERVAALKQAAAEAELRCVGPVGRDSKRGHGV